MNRKGINTFRERRSNSILRTKGFLRTQTHTTFVNELGLLYQVIEDVQKNQL